STKHHIEQGNRIVLFASRGIDAIVSMMAIARLGAMFVPIDPEYPEIRVREMLKDIDPALIVTDAHSHRILVEQYKIAGYVINSSSVKVNGKKSIADRSTLNAGAYIIHTSGSTGKPKGIVVGHRAMVDYVLTFRDYFSLHETDRVIHQSSLTFDTFLEEIFPVLLAGGAVVVCKEGSKNVANLSCLIQAQRATVLSTTPWVLNEFNRGSISGTSLRIMISGGDALQRSHVDKLLGTGIDIYNTYGPAETTVCATFHKIEAAEECDVIGQPITNHQVYIVDGRMGLVPVGIPGEICIAGTGLAEGYFQQEEQTRIKFIDNPFAQGLLYKTGDIGRWSPRGTIVFQGRSDHQVKINGYRIEPGEVEYQLSLNERIGDVAVIVREFEGGDKRLVAFYTSNTSVPPNDLRSFLAERLPLYMVPSFFVALPKIPLTSNKKTDVSALQAMSLEGQQARRKAAPRNRTEEELLQLFVDVFGHDDIGIDHNFFELGGNSLKATALIANIQRVLRKDISLRTLFLHPTVVTLGEYLTAVGATAKIRIDKAPEREHYPLSNSQKRIWVLHHLDQNSVAYSLSWVLNLKGEVNRTALQQAFGTLIERHKVLRTVFVLIDDEPRQIILPAERCKFNIRDRKLRDSRANLDQLIRSRVEMSIDLKAWPLFHAELIETDDKQFIFTFCIHHIIVDGWSLNLFAKELSALYNAYTTGEECVLPDQRIQYIDFVEWQERTDVQQQLNHERNYWLTIFSDGVPRLEIPTDFQRPAVQNYRGSSVEFLISDEVKRKLLNVGEKFNTSLFTILLTALKQLLFKYTGQEDIVVGVPVAGRDHFDIQDQLGLFLNVLPVRTFFRKTDSFAEILRAVDNAMMDALDNQHYPFDLLVQDLRLPVDASRSPVFDVMVGYQDIRQAHNALNDLKDVTVSSYPFDRSISQFDLSIDFFDVADGLQAKIEYNTDLFAESRIRNIVGHLDVILSTIVENENTVL
ncbi:MAG: amino acid adenylation domain-containing protein, partial [Bacteroidota bacterium]